MLLLFRLNSLFIYTMNVYLVAYLIFLVVAFASIFVFVFVSVYVLGCYLLLIDYLFLLR